MFWLDRWPWQLWWITQPLIWATCTLVGHHPIRDGGQEPFCAWCLHPTDKPAESVQEAQK